ncbi:hypothetical protein LTR05_007434 [Lithohypha guttulata]|uniref:C2H2-type domain-containing protein n=1 Tax=Lithohypha guttulata TaxID=1690604 RepID=A0AAN7SV23_9EURO|nr:hypothetical protein LTR05_007434 [Lithohypha guttulata]
MTDCETTFPSCVLPPVTRRSCYGTVHHGRVATPAPAYPDVAICRSKSSIPIRLIRRITRKPENDYDPDTIPVLSRREQRKAEKREKRKLEELDAYQRKQFQDRISRQLEVNQNTREAHHSQPQPKRSVRQKVKDTLRRSVHSSKRVPAQRAPLTPQDIAAPTPSQPPHVNDFHSKNDLRSWFHPSDVEAGPVSATNVPEPYLAELPAADVLSPHPFFHKNFTKQDLEDHIDVDTLPLPVRSPSPCLSSSTPRRGITISETPATLPVTTFSKQMQCDYCHGAIKMNGFHYACALCNGGDCLYCANCAHEGRTCRHELVEKTRNIKRHPTNPGTGVHKPLSLNHKPSDLTEDKESAVSSGHSVHSVDPSTIPISKTLEDIAISKGFASSKKGKEPSQSLPLPMVTSEDIFRDFETKRREQDIAFREKEVTLREREAILREREAWSASKEREATLMQQYQTAAMLQQRADLSARFTSNSPSSQSQFYGPPISRSGSQVSRSFARRLSSSARSTALDFTEQAKPPQVERLPSQAASDVAFATIESEEARIRTHANSNKRKSAGSVNRTSDSVTNNKIQEQNRRTPSNRSVDEPEEDQESEESDTSASKRQKHEASAEPQKLFACPYHKHDPVRYAQGNTTELHYRGCVKGLFRDISRMKQHLKRVHHYPGFYCRRCFEVFDTNDKLQDHSSLPEACEPRDCPYAERINETKQVKIHVKRPGKDPKDLWFEIFTIIFPGSPLPDSPYIERAQSRGIYSELLEQFVELFNRKLDIASQSRPWLASTPTRDFLNGQMLQTMQELHNSGTSTSVRHASLLSSPVSTASGSGTRQSSRSSRESSSVQEQQTSVSCSSQRNRGVPRPALIVSTTCTTQSSAPLIHSSNAVRSRQSSSFPRVPTHVGEDLGYGPGGESWASGDDVRLMSNAPPLEPSSATSTRSTKSVSFAPAPQEWRLSSSPDPKAAELSNLAGFDWHDDALLGPSTSSSSEQLPFSSKSYQPRPRHSRTDSAYGTMSSAQASQSSLAQPKPQSYQTQASAFDLFHNQQPQQRQQQLAYIDPRMLFVNPSELTAPMFPGVSADLQAYLNRDLNTCEFGSQASFDVMQVSQRQERHVER